ncbi:hypothetical protein JCM21900_004368 [Sporobolomyces salmonicolor]
MPSLSTHSTPPRPRRPRPHSPLSLSSTKLDLSPAALAILSRSVSAARLSAAADTRQLKGKAKRDETCKKRRRLSAVSLANSLSSPPPAYEAAVQETLLSSTVEVDGNDSTGYVEDEADGTASDDDPISDSDDPLNDLLRLTASLLTTSSEILAASSSLHDNLTSLLSELSHSPPRLGSVAMEEVELRSELALLGENDDRLDQLAREVERFEVNRNGRDPRRALMGGKTSGVAAVGMRLGMLREEEAVGAVDREARADKGRMMLVTAEVEMRGSSAAALGVGEGREATQGHARRTSAAADLLQHLAATSTSSSSPTLPSPSSSTLRPCPLPRSRTLSSLLPPSPTPAASPVASTSRSTLDLPAEANPSKSLPPSPASSPPLSRRLRRSPSFHNLHASASPSTAFSNSPGALAAPSLSRSASSSTSISTLVSPSIPSRAVGFAPPSSPTLSLSPSPSFSSDFRSSPSHSPGIRSRPSYSTHRRISTLNKSISIAGPLATSASLASVSIDDLFKSAAEETALAVGSSAAADQLRQFSPAAAAAAAGRAARAEPGGGGSWWSWR